MVIEFDIHGIGRRLGEDVIEFVNVRVTKSTREGDGEVRETSERRRGTEGVRDIVGKRRKGIAMGEINGGAGSAGDEM
jgi:hypothetical protein